MIVKLIGNVKTSKKKKSSGKAQQSVAHARDILLTGTNATENVRGVNQSCVFHRLIL